MDRRMGVAVVAAIVAMVVLILAASSAPVDVWTTPPSDSGSAVVDDPSSSTVAQEPSRESRPQLPGWVNSVALAIGVFAAVVAIVSALVALRYLRMPVVGRFIPRRRRPSAGSVLPEVDERDLTVDVDAARSALSGGTPRNAIVACWMQLERGAADAGLPPHVFETPTEYVERVIGASSVDPAPIGELAALYREARFSRHPLSDDHRTRALMALERVAAALQHDVGALT